MRGQKQLLAWLSGQIEQFQNADAEVKAWIAEGQKLSDGLVISLRLLAASRDELLEAMEQDDAWPADWPDDD